MPFAGLSLGKEEAKLTTGEGWRMEVTDEAGHVGFRLDFSFHESPPMLELF